MLRSPPRSPPGTIPLSIPKAGDRQHPRSAPIPPPHSVWDYRWTSGACQEAERAGDSSFGPSPPHSLQTQAVGRTLAPALGTPQPAAGPASPMTERDGSHLVRGRRCYGDPQTKPSSCLQAEAPPWTKPCEHLLEPHPRGPGGLHIHAIGDPQPLQSPRSCTVLGQDLALSSPAGTRLHWLTLTAMGH